MIWLQALRDWSAALLKGDVWVIGVGQKMEILCRKQIIIIFFFFCDFARNATE